MSPLREALNLQEGVLCVAGFAHFALNLEESPPGVSVLTEQVFTLAQARAAFGAQVAADAQAWIGRINFYFNLSDPRQREALAALAMRLAREAPEAMQ